MIQETRSHLPNLTAPAKRDRPFPAPYHRQVAVGTKIQSAKESLPRGRTVPKITIEVPEELSEQLAHIGDRLPELLRLSLQQPVLLAQTLIASSDCEANWFN